MHQHIIGTLKALVHWLLSQLRMRVDLMSVSPWHANLGKGFPVLHQVEELASCQACHWKLYPTKLLYYVVEVCYVNVCEVVESTVALIARCRLMQSDTLSCPDEQLMSPPPQKPYASQYWVENYLGTRTSYGISRN